MSESTTKVRYEHPKCGGCGHNFFEFSKMPIDSNGRAIIIGLCRWCMAENGDEERLKRTKVLAERPR